MELPTLTGTAKDVAYAEVIRADTIREIEKRIEMHQDPSCGTGEKMKMRTRLAFTRAHQVDDAGWWLYLSSMGNVTERINTLTGFSVSGSKIKATDPLYLALNV